MIRPGAVAGSLPRLETLNSCIAVGTTIARRPRTDPGERHYRTGLHLGS